MGLPGGVFLALFRGPLQLFTEKDLFLGFNNNEAGWPTIILISMTWPWLVVFANTVARFLTGSLASSWFIYGALGFALLYLMILSFCVSGWNLDIKSHIDPERLTPLRWWIILWPVVACGVALLIAKLLDCENLSGALIAYGFFILSSIAWAWIAVLPKGLFFIGVGALVNLYPVGLLGIKVFRSFLK
jgi:uncharacterized membrane protein